MSITRPQARKASSIQGSQVRRPSCSITRRARTHSTTLLAHLGGDCRGISGRRGEVDAAIRVHDRLWLLPLHRQRDRTRSLVAPPAASVPGGRRQIEARSARSTHQGWGWVDGRVGRYPSLAEGGLNRGLPPLLSAASAMSGPGITTHKRACDIACCLM
eukprot:428699-Rhodomonas_salina.2